MALSDVKVRSAKSESKAYKLTDGEGMVVLTHPFGPEYWWLRYRFGGKEKMLMLGKYPEVSLADTQARRDEARKRLANFIGKRNIAELKTRDLLVPIKVVESFGCLEVASRLQQRTT